MLIDWFTVVAQIINFLVLVGLLKHFLYGRIVKAMDEREEKIASRLREADERKEKAEQEAQLYSEKNEQFDAERDEMLARARKEVETKRKELMHEAREEVAGAKERWLEAIRQERESFLTDLRETMCKEVYKTARRALADLANTDVERRMIALFTERIPDLDLDGKTKSERPARKSMESITVRTAFEIPRDMRERITDVLQERFDGGAAVEFEVSSNLICGIELKTLDRKVAWSIADYMDSLEQSVAGVIEEETQYSR